MPSLKVGIVGLPNVGKSTLFNALLKKRVALSANYPFATVEPNIGVVAVPDERLGKLAELVKNEEKLPSLPPLVPAAIEFVDIAGLVKGASTGAGLGNKFLSHIREVDAIVHVLRDFSDPNIIREGSENPETDREVVETELQVADLTTAQKLLEASEKDRANSDRDVITTALQCAVVMLQEGKSVSGLAVPERLEKWKKSLPLLTMKPVLYVYNVGEEDMLQKLSDRKENVGDGGLIISARIEEELSDLSEEERSEYLESVGLKETGLEKLIEAAYKLLDLISFLTAGEKEVRAWTIRAGTKAPQAAAVIHTDFEKNFIRAQVVEYEKLVEAGSYAAAKQTGSVRIEGKDYEMRDGDVVEFLIGS